MSDNWSADNPYPTEHSADTTDRTYRIEICNQCEFLTELKFCNKCNCFMPIKTYLKSKKCPLSKW